MIGSLLVVTAVSQLGFTSAGVAVDVLGVAASGLGFRFGYARLTSSPI